MYKVIYANINYNYLFTKEYKAGGELLRIIRSIYFNPHSGLLPISISCNDNNESNYYKVMYYYNMLAERIFKLIDSIKTYDIYRNKKEV